MRNRYFAAAALLLALPLAAHASCDTVKSSIDAKLKAKGLSGYSLDVVSSGQASDGGKVVGNCEGDKQIVYTRGDAASASGVDSSTPAADSSTAAPAKPAHHHKHHAAKKSDEPAPAQSAAAGG